MRNAVRNRAVVGALTLALGVSACASMNKTEKGAVIGAAAGAGAGAVIGNQVGSTAKGAIIGAVVGGAAGALIGSRMDKQAKELAMEIPGARVERIGEGIVVTFDSGLLFGYDSHVINAAAGSNLTNLARSLENYPKTDVLIVGHTDATGSTVYNQGLSDRRANAAMMFLQQQSVAQARLRPAGRGESDPIAVNTTETGRAQNRRVEIVIVASEEMKRAGAAN
jgi:outer membrane protein OmpA-like peptidoglycan-associated protein